MRTGREHVTKRAVHASGFTLVELMVVLAIIGVLTTIVAVNVFKSRDVANVRAAEMGLSNITTAIDFFQMEKGRFPASLEELKQEEFISGSLQDPWGVEYQYATRMSNDGTRIIDYTVISAGPDRQFGTADDIMRPEARQTGEADTFGP